MPYDEPTSIDGLPKYFVDKNERARRSRTSAARRHAAPSRSEAFRTRNTKRQVPRGAVLVPFVVRGSAHALPRARVNELTRRPRSRSNYGGVRRHCHCNSRSPDPNATAQAPGGAISLTLSRAGACDHRIERAPMSKGLPRP